MKRETYVEALQTAMGETCPQWIKSMTDDELRASIDELCGILRGPLDDAERIDLSAHRKHMRAELSERSK